MSATKSTHMNFKHTFFAIIVLATLQTARAQKKDGDIGTEVVNVVKPYTPTISDAFKVKETPVLDDEETTKKTNIKYNIFSFPVASTFTPSKGRAASVEKSAQERLFKNFATLALGNYGTVNAELFVTENVGENGYVGAMLRHLSSQGGINGVELNDSFSNSSADLTYGNRQQTYAWNIDGGYQYQGYNWYGLPDDFGFGLTDDDRQALLNSIEPQHVYHNAYVGGKISFNESIVNVVSIKYDRFWDTYGAEENRFIAKPKFHFDINKTQINTNIIVDYVNGGFDENFNFGLQKYSFLNLGIQPSFNMVRDDWSINFGATAFYSMDSENSDSKFFIYPNITASYKIAGDAMVFYAGAEGGLQQNSYRDFTNENPYLSPSIAIAPTDRQFDVYGGLKGKIANMVSYNVRGGFTNERDRALFIHNPYSFTVSEPFEYGNSFGVVYDDLRTISVFGELKADFSKNVSFGIDATFSKYDVAFGKEAWNLPELNAGASLDVTITPKWYAGARLFFVSERKDQLMNTDSFETADGITVTLDSYFDVNAHVGFKYNDRLTGFLKLNNIANQSYEKWLNYPVQGIQVMLGASYKFDF